MHYTSLTLTALVASAASSAVPVINGRSTLLRREVKPGDTIWPEGGHTTEGGASLTFSPNRAVIGEVEANTILQRLADACTQTVCNPSAIDPIKAQVYTEDTLTDFELTIEPDGDYAAGDREALFQILTKAANLAQSCETIKYQDTFTCSSVGGSPGWCPTNEPKDVKVCAVPDFWSVQIGDSQIKVVLKAEQDESAKNWCEDFVGAAGDAASQINEAVGQGAAIGSIMCGFS